MKPILLTLLLCGCASFGQAVVTPPKEVSVPVITPCVQDIPQKPVDAYAASEGKSVEERTLSLRIFYDEAIVYESGLEAVIAGCR